MDNLTHSLIGAALGQAGLKRKTGLAMPALILAANLPDVDAPCAVFGIESLAMRRGLSHGPIALLVLPAVLAAIIWWFDKWQAGRGKRPEARLPVRFGWLLALCYLGAFSHPLFDWFNNYGIRLLEPFSHQWFYGDTLFIIDVWIIAGLGWAVWFSLRRERAGRGWRWPAITALAGLAGYVALNLAITAGALLTLALNNKGRLPPGMPSRDLAIAVPRPVLFWERDLLIGRHNDWHLIPAEKVPSPRNAEALTLARCAWPDVERIKAARPDLAAFLFWSRAPFVERQGQGIVFRDARFYDPRVRDRFSVTVSEEPCRPVLPGQ
ncbi:MAG: metal-dependent hydrolase [Novosphingobium sp.]|uniref:metal-dependent hydrolase n=1 Tax=Novosphingobium sp. TaxID=1874826 RepID=UPI0032BC6546